MVDFSIRSHFAAFRNSASEESKDEICHNLLDSMLALSLYIFVQGLSSIFLFKRKPLNWKYQGGK